ncbi:MAG: response regulator [bacterium]|jgi:CheY-like chemotaxis protein
MNSTRSSSSNATARILLVDDNRLGLAARKALLEEQSYDVTTATEGQEALGLFTTGHFDVVVTDFRMPRMNGLKLIAEIRARSPETPIILISGYADMMGFDEQNTGADVVIAKSANEVPQLIRSVKRLLHAGVRKPPRSQRPSLRRKAGSG